MWSCEFRLAKQLIEKLLLACYVFPPRLESSTSTPSFWLCPSTLKASHAPSECHGLHHALSCGQHASQRARQLSHQVTRILQASQRALKGVD
jgi:hypothetical protein